MYSGKLCLPCPSAMLDGIDTAARRIWLTRPNFSAAGIRDVTRYTRFVNSIAFCHAIRSRNVLTVTLFSLDSVIVNVNVVFVVIEAAEQLEALANRRQHAECEAVDFEYAQCVDVVLVPLDECAVGHGAVLEGNDFAEWRFGDDEAADVLREVAREAEDLFDQADDHLDRAVVGIEAGMADDFLGNRFGIPPVQRLGERVDAIEREAEDLADIAQGGLGAIGDDFGGNGRPLAAVLVVDVLEDFFAALVLEVYIDVRRLVAFATDEAFEKQVDTCGIDGGDAEAITDGGVRRRAAALAENALAAGEADEVPDGEEVVFVFEFGDEGEFGFELAVDTFRKPRSHGATEPRRGGFWALRH